MYDFKSCNEDGGVKTPLSFAGIGACEKQFDSFLQIDDRLFNCLSLTRHVQFRTQGHIEIVFLFENGSIAAFDHTYFLLAKVLLRYKECGASRHEPA
jgi:hypothetical protein